MRLRSAILACAALLMATAAFGADGKAGAPVKIHGMANQYKYALPKDSDFWKQMEKRFNVDYTVDWVPADSYNQKVDIILASGDLPDVMQVQSMTQPSVLKAIKSGAFKDITAALGDFSKYPNLAKLNPMAWRYSKVDGKNYLVPRTRGNLDLAVFIRGDWLDKLGLKTPTTIDEYTNYLKLVCAKDLDGNGKIDTIGMIPSMSPGEGYYSAAFGTREPVYTKDGGILQKYLTDNYANYVAYLRDCYAKGLIAKEYALIRGTQEEAIFLSGQSASLVKNSWHKYRIEQELKKVDPKARVVLLPYLVGSAGMAHYYDLGYFGGMLISSQVSDEKLAAILRFFDATAAAENYNFVNFGIEGVDWVMKDGAPSLTEKGQQEVTSSFNAPFIFATNEFAKVDSPLAPMSYNLKTREEMKVLYSKKGKADIFNALQSDSWRAFWSKTQDEFIAQETDAVTGRITMDQFKAYQKQLADSPEAKASAVEFAKSYKQIYGN
jgi:ABC-type sugar transport system, periplasmic component